MAFVSITRLRVRPWRYLPAFFVQSLRSAWQAKSEIGCLAVAVLRDTGNAFWTRTVWENEDAMRSFVLSGVHQRGMHRLREWCDEVRSFIGFRNRRSLHLGMKRTGICSGMGARPWSIIHH